MTSRRSAARLVGVDVARCLALLGMMATHVYPRFGDDGTSTLAFDVAAGRASALFAVLAGVSLALTTGRTTPLRGRPLAAAASGIAVRAVLVTAVGLVLGRFESGVAVILAYYGVMFLLAVPFLGLRSRALFAVAVPWLVLAPVVSHVVRPALPVPDYLNPTFSSLTALPQLLGELALTGYYPAVPWLGYLLLGLAIGRCDLRRWSSAGVLVALGGAVVMLSIAASDYLLTTPAATDALLAGLGPGQDARLALTTGFYGTTPTDSWWWLAIRAPHSGTPFDLLQTSGSACVVLGVCLVLGRLAPGPARMVFGAGAMTLSLYSLHVVLLATTWQGLLPEGTYVRHVAVALVLGAFFAMVGWRGPLERVVGAVSDVVRRVVGGRPPAPADAAASTSAPGTVGG